MVSTQNTKHPGTEPTGVLLLLVLAALADQTVKPLAQIVGNDLCCDSLDKCDECVHGFHLHPAVMGMEKGRMHSITQKAVSRNSARYRLFLVYPSCFTRWISPRS